MRVRNKNQKPWRHGLKWILAGAVLFGLNPLSSYAQTQMTPVLPKGIAEGQGIIVPGGTKWAIALGKALFWDQQVGSDGLACASCHFHAGADVRLTNEVNPGFNDLTVGVTPGGEISTGGDTKFGSTAGTNSLGTFPDGFRPGRPDGTLLPSDFPGHHLADVTNRDSALISTTNDRVSSQGAFSGIFDMIRRFGKKDSCSDYSGAIFYAGYKPGQYPARQVEPRNTPSVINSAFNHRQFWDGRANNMFNGVGIFGMRDIAGNPAARLIAFDGMGNPYLTYLQLENGSLASQAVAPVVNAVEMSCNGRTFADVGRKLLLTLPLAQQQVASTDSVLGQLDAQHGKGLDPNYNYGWLIKKAFDPKWWAANGDYSISATGVLTKNKAGYTQIETNFSMFWGIAIMMYESTLTSNQSEFDRLTTSGALVVAPPFGGPPGPPCTGNASVDPLLVRGCILFNGVNFGPPPDPTGKGFTPTPTTGVSCLFCHAAPTFSEAQQTVEANAVPFTAFTVFLAPVTDVGAPGRGPENDLRDNGFANIGIRPVFTDLMSGRVDSYGNPLSFGRQYYNYLQAIAGGQSPTVAAKNNIFDPALQNAINAGGLPTLGPTGTVAPNTFAKLEVDGASKVPSLRNVGLTPPYFSWGYYSNLRQVMQLYNRGLSRRNVQDTNASVPLFDQHGTSCTDGDDSGTGPDGNTPYATLVQIGGQPHCDTNITGLINSLGLSDCSAPVGTTPYNFCIRNSETTSNDDIAAMVRFLLSLTDSRVQCSAAPFDHPSLLLPIGQLPSDFNHNGQADDILTKNPAVGAAGFNPKSGNCLPNTGDLFGPGVQTDAGGLGVKVTLQ